MKNLICLILVFSFIQPSFASGTTGTNGSSGIYYISDENFVPGVGDDSYKSNEYQLNLPAQSYTYTFRNQTSFDVNQPPTRAQIMNQVSENSELDYEDESDREQMYGPFRFNNMGSSSYLENTTPRRTLDKLQPMSADLVMPEIQPLSFGTIDEFAPMMSTSALLGSTYGSTPNFGLNFNNNNGLSISAYSEQLETRERIECDNLAGDLISLKDGQDELPICSGMSLGETMQEIEDITRQMSYYNVLQEDFLDNYSTDEPMSTDVFQHIIQSMAEQRKNSEYKDLDADKEDSSRYESFNGEFDEFNFALGKEADYLKELGCNDYLAPDCVETFSNYVKDGKMPVVDAKIGLLAKKLDYLKNSIEQYKQSQIYADYKNIREYLMAEIEVKDCKSKWNPWDAISPSDYLEKIESSICQRNDPQEIYGEEISELANDMTNIVRALERENIESEKQRIASVSSADELANFPHAEQCARLMKHSNDFIMRCEYFMRGGDFNNQLNINLDEVEEYGALSCNYDDKEIQLSFKREGYQDRNNLETVERNIGREFVKEHFAQLTQGLSLEEKILLSYNEPHQKDLEDLLSSIQSQNIVNMPHVRERYGISCEDIVELNRRSNEIAGSPGIEGMFNPCNGDDSDISSATLAGLVGEFDVADLTTTGTSGGNSGNDGASGDEDDIDVSAGLNNGGSTDGNNGSGNQVIVNNPPQEPRDNNNGLSPERREQLLELPHVSSMTNNECGANEEKVDGLCVVSCLNNQSRLPSNHPSNPYGCVVDQASVSRTIAAENRSYEQSHKRTRNRWIVGSSVGMVGLGVGAVALSNNGYNAGRSSMSNRLANSPYTGMYSGSGFGYGGYGSGSSYYGPKTYSNYGAMSGVSSYLNGGAGMVFDPTSLRGRSSVYFPYQTNTAGR